MIVNILVVQHTVHLMRVEKIESDIKKHRVNYNIVNSMH